MSLSLYFSFLIHVKEFRSLWRCGLYCLCLCMWMCWHVVLSVSQSCSKKGHANVWFRVPHDLQTVDWRDINKPNISNTCNVSIHDSGFSHFFPLFSFFLHFIEFPPTLYSWGQAQVILSQLIRGYFFLRLHKAHPALQNTLHNTDSLCLYVSI